MPKLDKPAWEKFAANYALTNNAAASYRQSGAKGKQGRDAGKRGAEYRNKPEIRKRIEELRREIETDAAGEFAMSKHELLMWLSAVLRTPISQVDASHPLCQFYSEVNTSRRSSKRVVMVDKLKAAWMLAKLCGWHRQESASLPLAPQKAPPVDSDLMARRLAAQFSRAASEIGSGTAEKFPPQVLATPQRANRPPRVPVLPLMCCHLVAS